MKKWIKLFCIEVLQKMNKKYSQVLSYSIPKFNVDVQPDRCNNNSNELNSTVAKTSSKKSPMPTRKNTYLLSDEWQCPYGKLWTEFFPSFYGPSVKRSQRAGHANKEGKKRRSTTCRTDRANEANKMFIIWLCWLFRERNKIIWHLDRWSSARGPDGKLRNWPITAREISQPYNN